MVPGTVLKGEAVAFRVGPIRELGQEGAGFAHENSLGLEAGLAPQGPASEGPGALISRN